MSDATPSGEWSRSAEAQRQYNLVGGAILAAAEQLAAPILYSEDMNHGQLYETVRVLNPFRPN